MNNNSIEKEEQKPIDPETKRILDIFKWSLDPAEFKEWWAIECEAKRQAEVKQKKRAEAEKKEWGEVKVFASKKRSERDDI